MQWPSESNEAFKIQYEMSCDSCYVYAPYIRWAAVAEHVKTFGLSKKYIMLFGERFGRG